MEIGEIKFRKAEMDLGYKLGVEDKSKTILFSIFFKGWPDMLTNLDNVIVKMYPYLWTWSLYATVFFYLL